MSQANNCAHTVVVAQVGKGLVFYLEFFHFCLVNCHFEPGFVAVEPDLKSVVEGQVLEICGWNQNTLAQLTFLDLVVCDGRIDTFAAFVALSQAVGQLVSGAAQTFHEGASTGL